MLPMLPVIAKTRIALTCAAAAAAIALTPATPALAWGKNEQKFLAGVLTTLAVGAIVNEARKSNARPSYQPAPQPVYVPAPTYHSSATALAFAEFSPASKRAIQRRLAAYGYYRGGIDRVYGPGTRAALEAYARNTGNAGALQSRDGAVRLMNSLLA